MQCMPLNQFSEQNIIITINKESDDDMTRGDHTPVLLYMVHGVCNVTPICPVPHLQMQHRFKFIVYHNHTYKNTIIVFMIVVYNNSYEFQFLCHLLLIGARLTKFSFTNFVFYEVDISHASKQRGYII